MICIVSKADYNWCHFTTRKQCCRSKLVLFLNRSKYPYLWDASCLVRLSTVHAKAFLLSQWCIRDTLMVLASMVLFNGEGDHSAKILICTLYVLELTLSGSSFWFHREAFYSEHLGFGVWKHFRSVLKCFFLSFFFRWSERGGCCSVIHGLIPSVSLIRTDTRQPLCNLSSL